MSQSAATFSGDTSPSSQSCSSASDSQAVSIRLLAIERPDDAVTLSGIATVWQTLADQIDRYHARQHDLDSASSIPFLSRLLADHAAAIISRSAATICSGR